MKDPVKHLLDPRDIMNPRKLSMECPDCKYLNHRNAIDCYNCSLRLAHKFNWSTRYKRIGSKYLYTKKEHEFALDYTNKNYKDFLQPTVYNKQTKKFEDNPEFIKVYGDPTKKKVDFGSQVESDLKQVIDSKLPNDKKLVDKIKKQSQKRS